jgi:lactoylglutathione lyase
MRSSLIFSYQTVSGVQLLRYRDVPDDKYSNAFLGYGPETSHFAVELTYNYGKDSYDIGEGFGHFGLAVEDVFKTVDSVKAAGGKVRTPFPKLYDCKLQLTPAITEPAITDNPAVTDLFFRNPVIVFRYSTPKMDIFRGDLSL